MENLDLLKDGDDLERNTWAKVRDWFPQYEEFWRLHLVPLRAPGSIHLRPGVNEDFESLAIFHYSAYVNLERAIEKIHKPVEGNLRFPDEIYLRLYAAAELGAKLVDQFGSIYKFCLKRKPELSSQPLWQLRGTLGQYRNLIHEQVPAVCLHDDALMMPRREKLDQYRRWTKVLYDANQEDFVVVKVQLDNDLKRLCFALQDAWKKMCALSPDLVLNNEYLRRRDEGLSKMVLGSTRIAVSSNTAIYSPTAVVPVRFT